jgi:hypothetical protein
MLPVRRYEASASVSSPFYFVIVDEETHQPIPNATVRLIDPRYDPNDPEMQAEAVVTGSDGRAEYFLYANVTGRAGLLGRTETISYDPFVIRVDASNYELFLARLSNDTSTRSGRYTARPLGLTFPPPPSAVVGLRHKTTDESARSSSVFHAPARKP